MGEMFMEAAAPKTGGVGKMESGKSRTKVQNARPIMSAEEEDLIARIHSLIGDRWDLISGRLPNRTAEEVEKYWSLHERKDCEGNKIHRPSFIRLSPSFKFIVPTNDEDN